MRLNARESSSLLSLLAAASRWRGGDAFTPASLASRSQTSRECERRREATRSRARRHSLGGRGRKRSDGAVGAPDAGAGGDAARARLVRASAARRSPRLRLRSPAVRRPARAGSGGIRRRKLSRVILEAGAWSFLPPILRRRHCACQMLLRQRQRQQQH